MIDTSKHLDFEAAPARFRALALRMEMRSPKRRVLLVAIAAFPVMGIAFGSMIAKAGDDAGVYAFLRSQSRPAKARTIAPLPSLFVPSANRRVLGYAPANADRMNAFQYDRAGSSTARRQQLESASLSTKRLTDLGGTTSHLGLPRAAKYCVRLCDGFFFPLSLAESETDYGQATCNSLCPSAETQLFSAPAGSDGIELASAHGLNYSSLPNAYAYRKKVSKSCTCTSSGMGLNVPSIGNDHTLRKGDLIATEKGTRRFSSQAPSLQRLSSIWSREASVRATVAANIDRLLVSLQTNVAPRLKQPDRAPVPASAARVLSLKPAFERIETQTVAELGRRGKILPVELSPTGQTSLR